jgi:hypothetical protein
MNVPEDNRDGRLARLLWVMRDVHFARGVAQHTATTMISTL